MGTEKTHVTPKIVKPEDDPVSSLCELQWEINSEDNGESTNYYLGSSYYARLYTGKDIGGVTVFSTNGTLSSSGSGTASKTEQISFSGENTSSISFPYSSGFSYKIIGKAYSLTGRLIYPRFAAPNYKGKTVVASASCFCILEVTYKAFYDKYRFSSQFGGESILVATATCGGEQVSASITVTFEDEYSSSSSQRSASSFSESISSGPSGTSKSKSESKASWYSSSSESFSSSSSFSVSSSASIVQTTTVTLIYKDFVTGEVISDVIVSVDGEGRGSTDSTGKITIHGITTNIVHTLKASREGYLTTDSDSLANDSFIINT